MRRVGFLIWKELIELKADPRLFGIVIVAPILQLFMLGYAATTDVRDVPIVVADADRSAASRDLIARFDASPNFTIVGDRHAARSDIDPYLEGGRAWMALAIPVRLRRNARRAATRRQLQVIADGSDANSTNVALGYATNLIAAYAQELAAGRMPQGMPVRGGIEPRVRVWFNPRLESRDFMMPGVLALLLLVITTNLSSMGIVREKELGTLEQLNVTPLRRWELIVGKLLPYALVGMLDVVPGARGRGLLVRGAAARQRAGCCSALTSVYLLTTLGLGLFVSTISSTQQQAMMTTTFFLLTPMIYLSGFIFPDREHAGGDSAVHVSDSAALFPGDSAVDFPEGCRTGDAVAAGAGADAVGRGDPVAGDRAVDQAVGVSKAAISS